MQIRYHGYDVILNPEENVFWREAMKAKFQGGKKLPLPLLFPILSFTLSPIILS